MDWLYSLIDAIKWLLGLAKPENLRVLIEQIGVVWVYAILFAIVFSETGLLVGFFLPGDSLLFTCGLLAAQNVGIDIYMIIGLLTAAAILGDALNYYLGLQMGSQVFDKGRLRFVKHDHLLAAKAFYERHGGKAIVLARFVPLVRTFTPFVAGVARMSYREFAFYNIAGGVAWVVSMSMAGYLLGNIPIVENNFEAVVLLIVAISVLPIVFGAISHWRNRGQGSGVGGQGAEIEKSEVGIGKSEMGE